MSIYIRPEHSSLKAFRNLFQNPKCCVQSQTLLPSLFLISLVTDLTQDLVHPDESFSSKYVQVDLNFLRRLVHLLLFKHFWTDFPQTTVNKKNHYYILLYKNC